MIKQVKKRNGRLEDFNVEKINACAQRACEGLENVSASELILDSKLEFYEKIPTHEIDQTLILSARSKIYKEPNWSIVASRLLRNSLYKEVLGESVDSDTFESDYRSVFIRNLKRGVKAGIFRSEMAGQASHTVGVPFDLRELSAALVIDRDEIIEYVGVKNLYDRYFLKIDGKCMETPQAFYMRVAMGLSINEENPTETAIKLYHVYSQHLASPSTPTLFNSGSVRSQLSSCYLSSLSDSVDGIFDGLTQEARKSKFAGGLGFHVTQIRGMGSHIHGTNGTSSGLIPWLKIYNDMLIACDQAGRRRGSGCAYLEPWHIDIEEFIELRKETGDERRRTHDLNTALWCPDLFFQRIEEDGDWMLICPSEARDLHESFGEEFNKKYIQYEEKAKSGEIKKFKIIKAKTLWKNILRSLFETSHPWITFKDRWNERYQNPHIGILHGSNLCCVTGDQRFPTEFGFLTAKEAEEMGETFQVAGKDGLENTSRMAQTIPNAPILKVTTKEGYEHRVTHDHPLWVKDVGWIEAQDLKSGDKVLVQNIEGPWGKIDLPREAFLMGVASSGNINKNGAVRVYPRYESIAHEIKSFEKLVVKVATIEAPAFSIEKWKHLSFEDCSVRTLLDLGFSKENKYKVPDIVWKGNKSTVSEYLRGLYLCSGFISSSSKIGILSFSRSFLQEIQLLFSNFGIRSSIKTEIQVGGYNNTPVKTTWRLEISSQRNLLLAESFLKIFERDGLRLCVKDKKLPRHRDFAVVKSVMPDGSEDTYCLNVLSNPNKAWSCQGLITKNTEIGIHTKPSTYDPRWGNKTEIGETGVCTLASLCLPKFVNIEDKTINTVALAEVIRVVVRGLDNIIDVNYNPTMEAELSSTKNRDIGMGTMGWSDVYEMLDINQDSEEAIEFADSLMEFISYNVIKASVDLAKERGSFERFDGSNWSKGILPIDTYKGDIATTHRFVSEEQWAALRNEVKTGMRNAQVMAIAPNASIGYLLGCNQSIEPPLTCLFRYENKSGNYYIINKNFVNDLKKAGLWNNEMAEALKAARGDVSLLNIPDRLKSKYSDAMNKDLSVLIRANAARQKWIDQGISFNLYNSKTSLKYLSDMYLLAWRSGLKSTYYLRNKSASNIAQVTTKITDSTQADVEEYSKWLAAQKEAAESGSCEMCEG